MAKEERQSFVIGLAIDLLMMRRLLLLVRNDKLFYEWRIRNVQRTNKVSKPNSGRTQSLAEGQTLAGFV